MIKKFEEFVDEHNTIQENINQPIQLDFEPIIWGVEDFDDEAEEDNGIPVTITRFASGGRENIESNWKIYALENLDDRWNVKAICIDSEDRRYQPEDEVEFEVFKDDKIWDIESRLQDTLNEQGF